MLWIVEVGLAAMKSKGLSLNRPKATLVYATLFAEPRLPCFSCAAKKTSVIANPIPYSRNMSDLRDQSFSEA